MSTLFRPGLWRDLAYALTGVALGFVATEVTTQLVTNHKIKKTVREVENELHQRVAEDHVRGTSAEQHGGGNSPDGVDGPPSVS